MKKIKKSILLMIILFICISMIYLAGVTYASTELNVIDNSVSSTATNAYLVLRRIIQTGIIIARICAIILIIIAINTCFKKAKVRKLAYKEINETFTEEEKKIAKKENKIYGDRIIIFIIIAIVLLFMSGVLTIISEFAVLKPIIYIYPEEDGTSISVTVSNPEKLTCTYPKYNDGWKVVADNDGTLTDESGRKYYALYWEGKDYKISDFDEGFVVKSEDTAAFLEEKLAILGLNEREAEEFIVYWLPILEHNNYNLIRFKTAEEINSDIELEINPKPDTLIRVMMEYKPLMFKRDVKEQVLEKVERKGYTVVEWGGIFFGNKNFLGEENVYKIK